MPQERLMLPVGALVQDGFRGQYRVERLLGKGGFCAVYLVRDQRDRSRVFALKEVIGPNKLERKRLFFEYKVLKELHHQALPQVYHIFEQEKPRRVYLLMEYIEGKNLEVLRKEQLEGRFPVEQVLTLLNPIVEVIIYLHHREPPLLHRDITPANIIVSLDGRRATLVDFGLAKPYLPESTTSMFRFGTPGYTAIEQYSSEGITDIRTDIYGLGATLYMLLTGVKPVDAVKRFTTEKGIDALQPPSVLVPDLPSPISRAIQHAMSLHYGDRFATVEEFWQALHTDSGEQEEQTPTLRLLDTSRPPLFDERRVDSSRSARLQEERQDTRFRRRNRIVLFSLALLLSFLVLGSTFLFSLAPSATRQPFIRYTSVQGSMVPTPSVVVSPRAVTFPYPPIALSYAGRISDIAVANKTTNLYLVQVHQDWSSIAGNFQGLGLVGSFTGTVTPSESIHFVVRYGTGSLIFDGEVKVGGDIEGNFYALDQRGQHIDEYGLWYVGATA